MLALRRTAASDVRVTVRTSREGIVAAPGEVTIPQRRDRVAFPIVTWVAGAVTIHRELGRIHAQRYADGGPMMGRGIKDQAHRIPTGH
jgi:hypothetical protein